jgi:hypothetical protein
VVDGAHLVEPSAVADVFAKQIKSVYMYNNHCFVNIPSLSQSSEFSSLVPISNVDICKAIKRLKPKYLGLNDIPWFVIKGCSFVFISILRHIFNLSRTQQYFLAVWKEAVIVSAFKRDNYASVSNYKRISLLNNFPK